jgi:hypothetical protein
MLYATDKIQRKTIRILDSIDIKKNSGIRDIMDTMVTVTMIL